MPDGFVHLHAHSSYSLLDGLARIDDLLSAAAVAGMPALALTDHGTMFGAIEFYDRAQDTAVKPIIGCEVYVADRPLDQRPSGESSNYHLVLLAENEIGYHNLIRLTTEGHLRGYYRKPRVDHALLEKHAEGLICLSGCASSELAARLIQSDLAGAEELADWHRQIFPDRYFLELQYHDLEMQKTINQGILHLSRRLDLPLVATNDVHYTYAGQAPTHEILLCIQTQTTMSDPKRMRMETQEFYLKSAAQMQALFGEYPAALTNTLSIAERCNLSLNFGRPQLPRFKTPNGCSSEEHLRALCEDGLRRRYDNVIPEIRARLEYELEVITQTGFVDYFLLVYDVIRFARDRGIAVGPGRGSAAGSIVAYCLFVTGIDPVAHGLSFERFLNPHRISMPDMDLDFADDRRDEVLRYVTEQYGRDRVAQIITFGTIGPRAGVRDVGRVLGMSYPDTDRVAKLIPFMCPTVARAKEEVPDLQRLYDGDPAMKRLLDTVQDLEGVARHASTHAAGVVISRDPLIDHVPLYKVPKSEAVSTQYAMASIEKIGLLKMDFLALRTLTILTRAQAFVRQSTGETFSIEDIPLDDPSIYRLLSGGDTLGVFQVDGPGMRKAITAISPTEFRHVVALVALYRPGPMENIDKFARRKNGELEVTYDHPALEQVLKETYGIVVYQEQVLQLFALVAGYSLGEADLIRRAMGKKKAAELAKHHQGFLERAAERGTERAVAQRLWDTVEPFSGYAFNKAHAAAYAVLTCQTAWVKANYAAEYMAALLSAEKDSPEKVASALAECRRLGIRVLPPDLNRSGLDFSLEDGGIRFGLGAVKHVGTGSLEALLAEREQNGHFSSLEDFCHRADWSSLQKRTVESLARCGGFDSLVPERSRVVSSLERIVAFGTQMQRARLSGQTSLFGESSEEEGHLQLAVTEPTTLEQRVEWETELLGVPISRHPVQDADERFAGVGALPMARVTQDHQNTHLRLGGLIRSLRSFSTKSGRPMATFQLTDLHATVDAVAFSRCLEQVQQYLVEGAIVVADGRLDAGDGRVQLVVDAVYSLEDAGSHPYQPRNGNGHGKNGSHGNGHNGNGSRSASGVASSAPTAAGSAGQRVTVVLERGEDREADLRRVVEVYAVLRRFPGSDEVEILVARAGKARSIPLPERGVRCCPELETALAQLMTGGLHVSSSAPSA